MPKIVTVEQMQTIEKAADAGGHTYADMMDWAGQAVAERILIHLSSDLNTTPQVLVLVGSGNNGGDGLVAARYVKEHFDDADVSAYLLKAREDDIFQAAVEAGVTVTHADDDKKFKALKQLVAEADIVVDAVFGTGTRFPFKDDAASFLEAVHAAMADRQTNYPRPRSINPMHPSDDANGQPSFDHFKADNGFVLALRPYVIAVDCPTGVNCDTGEVEELVIQADETVTFAAAKLGLLTFPGAEAVGELYIADIGLPQDLAELASITLELSSAESVGRQLPPRPRHAHKGTFGKAFMVAGSINFVGAAALCATSAYRVGTGLVTGGVPQTILGMVAAKATETTWVLLPNNMGVINKSAAKIVREETADYDALLVGPGIGDEDETLAFMEGLLKPEDETKPKSKSHIGFVSPVNAADTDEEKDDSAHDLPPMVIDADGLNVLSKIEEWWKLLPANTILTPHSKEFARLCGEQEISTDRIKLAQAKAAEWNVIVVLKGAFTVVAAPDGRTTVSPFASPSLATAGTGDVLAGAITGLRAQGLEAYEAAVVGVWVHGWAGTHEQPKRGNIASDVAIALPYALEVAEAAAKV